MIKPLVTLSLLFAAATLPAQQQLMNLPLPASGLRYSSAAEIEPQWPAKPGEGVICLWGDDKFAPLSITIDDNNAPDIPFWRSMSEKYGWKFTWFLIVYPGMWDIYNDQPGNNLSYAGTAELWKTLYDEGHDIQLHGSCQQMNDLTPADYQTHIELSRDHLESVIGNEIIAYAYPCGKTGTDAAPGGYEAVIAQSFVGARGTLGGPTPTQLVDYLNTKSMGAVMGPIAGQSEKRFQQMEDPSRPWKYNCYRGWPVLLYHHVQEGSQAKVDLALAEIKANEDKYWVQPFSFIARYAQERESGTLTINSVTSGEIKFSLTDDMKDDVFNVPLTVKFCVEDWTGAAAAQNGQPLKTWIVEHDGATYALTNAVPDQGEVVLKKQ